MTRITNEEFRNAVEELKEAAPPEKDEMLRELESNSELLRDLADDLDRSWRKATCEHGAAVADANASASGAIDDARQTLITVAERLEDIQGEVEAP